MLGRLFRRKGAGRPEETRVEPTPRAVEIPPEKIAQRAYEIWCERGQQDGTADQNWLLAEAELRAELAPKGRADVRKSR